MFLRYVLFLTALVSISLYGGSLNAQSTLDLELLPFTIVKSHGLVDVELRRGPRHHAHVETPRSEDLDLLQLDVLGGELNIRINGRMKVPHRMKLVIETPHFEQLHTLGSGDVVFAGFSSFEGLTLYTAGSGDVSCTQPFTARDLTVDIKGAGDVDLGAPVLVTHALTLSIKGSGDVAIAGSASTTFITVHGSGDVEAIELVTLQADVRIVGSGDVSLHTDERLTLSIKGSGDVYFRGQPKVDAQIKGSGELIPK